MPTASRLLRTTTALLFILSLLLPYIPLANTVDASIGDGSWRSKFHPVFLEKIEKLGGDTVVEAVVRLKELPSSVLEKLRGNHYAAVQLLKQWASYTQGRVTKFFESKGVTIIRAFWIDNVLLVKARVSALKEIAKHPLVVRIFENFPVHALGAEKKTPIHYKPEKPGELPPSQSVESWGIYKIRAPEAWEAGFTGEGVRIAVLDTGVDISHPALQGKMFTISPGDPYYPGGWIEFDSDGNPVCSEPHDTDGHGTHTSGTALGGDTEDILIGVAPSAKLMHGLVLPGGSGTFASVLAGIEWAVDPYDCNGNPTGYPAHVISMSLGASNYYGNELLPGIRNALLANIVVVAAIGNDGPDTSSNPGNIWGVFGVGATDINDNPADFSSGEIVNWPDPPEDWPFYDTYPSTYVKPDFSAPGVDITSAVPGGGYEAWSGTSMATPHVAGTVALVLEAAGWLNFDYPDTPERVYEILNATVIDLGDPGQDTRYGWGRIDAYEAVMEAVKYAKTTGVEGVVLDAIDNTPVSWATVTVVEENKTVPVNATGGFRIPLDPGNYTLLVQAWGYQDKLLEVTVTVLNGTITGRVVDAITGDPIEGAVVRVEDIGVENTTDGNGYYWITLPPGTYNVTASAENYYPESKQASLGENETIVLDFELTPIGNGTLAGHVYDNETGDPVAGALVWTEVGGVIVSNVTDENGYYELSLPAGSYTVYARATGYQQAAANATIAPYQVTVLDFYLEPIPPSIVVLGNVHYQDEPHIATVVRNAGYDNVVEYSDVADLLEAWLVNGTINPAVIIVDHWKSDRSSPTLEEMLSLLNAANATGASLVILDTSYSSTTGLQALYESSSSIEEAGYPAPDTRLYAYPSPDYVVVYLLDPDNPVFANVSLDGDNWFYLADTGQSSYADYAIVNFTDDEGVVVLAYVNDTYNDRHGVGVAVWTTPGGAKWYYLASWGESYWMQYIEPGSDGVYSPSTEKVLVNVVGQAFQPLGRSKTLYHEGFVKALQLYFEQYGARDAWKPVLGPKVYTKVTVLLDRQPHGYVEGRVVGSDGVVVEGALVEVLDTPVKTSTGSDGRFKLWLPLGSYTLRISKEGYREAYVNVTIESDGQTVRLGDVEIIRVPRVAVFLDYSGQIKSLVENNLGWYARDYTDIDELVNDTATGFYDLLIFAGYYGTSLSTDLPRDKFLEALDVAGTRGVNIIFLDQWGDYAYGVNALHTYLGDPSTRSYGYGASVYVYVRVEKPHPVFKGYNVGDMIQLHVGTGEDYAWFSGFSGETLGTLYLGTEYRGGAIAWKETEYGTKWLLMASFAPESYTPISDWTSDAVTVLLNAIKWMTTKPLDVVVQPSEAYVGDQVVVEARGAPAGTEIVFYLDGEEIGRARAAGGVARITFTVPEMPGGPHTVEAMSVDELYYGSAVLTVKAKATLSSTEVEAPGVVVLEATGLPAGETVEVRLDSNYLTMLVTSEHGSLRAKLNIPLVASGEHDLAVTTRTGDVLVRATITVRSKLDIIHEAIGETKNAVEQVGDRVEYSRALLSREIATLSQYIASLYNTIDGLESSMHTVAGEIAGLSQRMEQVAGILVDLGNETSRAVTLLIDLANSTAYYYDAVAGVAKRLDEVNASLAYIVVNATGKVYAALETSKGAILAGLGSLREAQDNVSEKLQALLEATATRQDIGAVLDKLGEIAPKLEELVSRIDGLKDVIVSKTGEVYALVEKNGEEILVRLGDLAEKQEALAEQLGEKIGEAVGEVKQVAEKAAGKAEEAAAKAGAAASLNKTIEDTVSRLEDRVEEAKTWSTVSAALGGAAAAIAALAALLIARRP